MRDRHDGKRRPMTKASGLVQGSLCGTMPLGVPRYRVRGNLLLDGNNVYSIQPELLDSKELVPTTENPAVVSDDNQDSRFICTDRL